MFWWWCNLVFHIFMSQTKGPRARYLFPGWTLKTSEKFKRLRPNSLYCSSYWTTHCRWQKHTWQSPTNTHCTLSHTQTKPHLDTHTHSARVSTRGLYTSNSRWSDRRIACCCRWPRMLLIVQAKCPNGRWPERRWIIFFVDLLYLTALSPEKQELVDK